MCSAGAYTLVLVDSSLDFGEERKWIEEGEFVE